MVTKNYGNKSEMERAQKEFLRQAMEMAGRAVRDDAEERASSSEVISEKPTEKPNTAVIIPAPQDSAEAHGTAETASAAEIEAVCEELAADEVFIDGAVDIQKGSGTSAIVEVFPEKSEEMTEETQEEPAAPQEQPEGAAEKEDNTTFFPDTCPVVFADCSESEDENVKAAYEILGEISESSRILGKIIAEESAGECTGECASELPPPAFANRIDKHNSGL